MYDNRNIRKQPDENLEVNHVFIIRQPQSRVVMTDVSASEFEINQETLSYVNNRKFKKCMET